MLKQNSLALAKFRNSSGGRLSATNELCDIKIIPSLSVRIPAARLSAFFRPRKCTPNDRLGYGVLTYQRQLALVILESYLHDKDIIGKLWRRVVFFPIRCLLVVQSYS